MKPSAELVQEIETELKRIIVQADDTLRQKMQNMEQILY